MKKIKSVQTMTPEQWRAVADGLLGVAPAVQTAFKQTLQDHPELTGTDYDPAVFEANLRAAVTAIHYVAAFDSDKCKFVLVEHLEDLDGMTAQELRDALQCGENRT